MYFCFQTNAKNSLKDTKFYITRQEFRSKNKPIPYVNLLNFVVFRITLVAKVVLGMREQALCLSCECEILISNKNTKEILFEN